MHSSIQKSKRIGYIDALRGFTMILVVVMHVAKSLGVETGDSACFHYYLLQFRMPLFFFISGFVFYRAGFVWSSENIKRFLSKKVVVQVVSPFLFMMCYAALIGYTVPEAVFNKDKLGYWFTFTLFEYFLLYIAIKKLMEAVGTKDRGVFVVMALVGLFLFFIPKQWMYEDGMPLFVSNTVCLLGVSQLAFFVFFIIGAYVKRYFQKVEYVLDNSHLALFAVVVYLLVNVFIDLDSANVYLRKALQFLLAICGVTMTFALFRKCRLFFSGNSPLSASLKFIGRRTLDIYLLHFFFLEIEVPATFLRYVDGSAPVREFFVSLLLALVVIAVSLAISSLVRRSEVLARFLFGVRKSE